MSKTMPVSESADAKSRVVVGCGTCFSCWPPMPFGLFRWYLWAAIIAAVLAVILLQERPRRREKHPNPPAKV